MLACAGQPGMQKVLSERHSIQMNGMASRREKGLLGLFISSERIYNVFFWLTQLINVVSS